MTTNLVFYLLPNYEKTRYFFENFGPNFWGKPNMHGISRNTVYRGTVYRGTTVVLVGSHRVISGKYSDCSLFCLVFCPIFKNRRIKISRSMFPGMRQNLKNLFLGHFQEFFGAQTRMRKRSSISEILSDLKILIFGRKQSYSS